MNKIIDKRGTKAMNCKRCGKEIIGDIQRYCNDCKRELRGEEPIKTNRSADKEKVLNEEKAVKEESLEQEIVKETHTEEIPEKTVKKKEKKSRIFSFGYILLVLFIIIITFLVSCMAGFAMGPILPL